MGRFSSFVVTVFTNVTKHILTASMRQNSNSWHKNFHILNILCKKVGLQSQSLLIQSTSYTNERKSFPN